MHDYNIRSQYEKVNNNKQYAGLHDRVYTCDK